MQLDLNGSIIPAESDGVTMGEVFESLVKSHEHLTSQYNQLIEIVAKQNADIEVLKAEITRLKVITQPSAQKLIIPHGDRKWPN